MHDRQLIHLYLIYILIINAQDSVFQDSIQAFTYIAETIIICIDWVDLVKAYETSKLIENFSTNLKLCSVCC